MAIDVNDFLSLLPPGSSSGNLQQLIDVLRRPNVPPMDAIRAVLNIQPAFRQGVAYAPAFEYLRRNYTEPTEPYGFKWLVDRKVGGMAKFDDKRNKDLLGVMVDLYRKGVRTIISIERDGATDWADDWMNWFDQTKWFGTFLADYHAPSVEHLDAYCNLVDERRLAGAVVTHCWGGTGRTGCFLAAYLVKSENMSAEGALKAVRERYNTHSVEMKVQYNALARYADYLHRQPSLPVETKGLDRAGGGHWDQDYGNAGIAADPGHKGDPGPQWKPGVDTKVMISSTGRGNSVPPYVSSEPRMRPQEVPHGKQSA